MNFVSILKYYFSFSDLNKSSKWKNLPWFWISNRTNGTTVIAVVAVVHADTTRIEAQEQGTRSIARSDNSRPISAVRTSIIMRHIIPITSCLRYLIWINNANGNPAHTVVAAHTDGARGWIQEPRVRWGVPCCGPIVATRTDTVMSRIPVTSCWLKYLIWINLIKWMEYPCCRMSVLNILGGKGETIVKACASDDDVHLVDQ